MDEYAQPQRSSSGSITIVILLLVTSLFSILTHPPTGLIAVPFVAADDAAATNSTASTTTVPLETTASSTTESSIYTSEDATQNTPASNSTSTLNNSTIGSLTSTSNSSTTSNSTTVNETVISVQISTTAFITYANSSTTAISNTNTTVAATSTNENSTKLTDSTTTIVITSTNTTTTANTTVSETTSTTHVQSSFRVDRWDWSTWNTMNGLGIWITNTGAEPLDIFSLSVTIGGSPAGLPLYPGPSQLCPLNPIAPQSQCLFMPLPSFNPTTGSSYVVVLSSSDGAQISFSATHGERSDDPHQFTIDAVSWTPTCCDYTLNVHITNIGGTTLDTDQMATLVTINGRPVDFPTACGAIAPGMQCNLTFRISTLTSYVIVITDPRKGDQTCVITPG